MPFLTELHLREAPEHGTDAWQLLQDLVYQGARDRFVVPSGEITDLASIPRIFQIGFPKNHTGYNRAAVLHDHLTGPGSRVSRKDADGLMRRAARESGTGFVRRWSMYAAVRVHSGYVMLKEFVLS